MTNTCIAAGDRDQASGWLCSPLCKIGGVGSPGLLHHELIHDIVLVDAFWSEPYTYHGTVGKRTTLMDILKHIATQIMPTMHVSCLKLQRLKIDLTVKHKIQMYTYDCSIYLINTF